MSDWRFVRAFEFSDARGRAERRLRELKSELNDAPIQTDSDVRRRLQALAKSILARWEGESRNAEAGMGGEWATDYVMNSGEGFYAWGYNWLMWEADASRSLSASRRDGDGAAHGEAPMAPPEGGTGTKDNEPIFKILQKQLALLKEKRHAETHLWAYMDPRKYDTGLSAALIQVLWGGWHGVVRPGLAGVPPLVSADERLVAWKDLEDLTYKALLGFAQNCFLVPEMQMNPPVAAYRIVRTTDRALVYKQEGTDRTTACRRFVYVDTDKREVQSPYQTASGGIGVALCSLLIQDFEHFRRELSRTAAARGLKLPDHPNPLDARPNLVDPMVMQLKPSDGAGPVAVHVLAEERRLVPVQQLLEEVLNGLVQMCVESKNSCEDRMAPEHRAYSWWTLQRFFGIMGYDDLVGVWPWRECMLKNTPKPANDTEAAFEVFALTGFLRPVGRYRSSR